MTIEQKVGQMLLFGWQADEAKGPSPSEGYPGARPETAATEVNTHARILLEEWQLGSVILMGRNVESPEQVARLHNSMQALCETPLFFTTDQEGGHVCRMKTPFTMMPGAMPLGATRSEDLAYRSASAVSRELSAIGINLDFAPCLDTNNNAENPIIGVRSYGEDPSLTTRLGVAQMRGYQETGTIACVKHFPGHGDTAVDSHLGLCTIPYGMDRLLGLEIAPFRAAIEAGVDVVMTAHIVFQALDPIRPGTLSPAVVNGLLRKELGFKGVAMTDCMEMKAISDNFGMGEAAVMAVEAGIDLLAACHTLERQRTMRQAILDAVKSGRLTESRIDESVQRILAVKEKYRLAERRRVDETVVMQVVGCPEHRALEQEIARRSITIARDTAGSVPLPQGRILVVGPEAPAGVVANGIAQLRGLADADVPVQPIGPEFPEERLEAIYDAAQTANAVVVLTKHREPWTITPQDEEAQARMVKSLMNLGAPLVVAAIRNPYDIKRFPEIPTYLCTYGYTTPSLMALAEVLTGMVEATGELPVTLPSESEADTGEVPAPPAGDTTAWGF